jgi:hypothetical protein
MTGEPAVDMSTMPTYMKSYKYIAEQLRGFPEEVTQSIYHRVNGRIEMAQEYWDVYEAGMKRAREEMNDCRRDAFMNNMEGYVADPSTIPEENQGESFDVMGMESVEELAVEDDVENVKLCED